MSLCWCRCFCSLISLSSIHPSLSFCLFFSPSLPPSLPLWTQIQSVIWSPCNGRVIGTLPWLVGNLGELCTGAICNIFSKLNFFLSLSFSLPLSVPNSFFSLHCVSNMSWLSFSFHPLFTAPPTPASFLSFLSLPSLLSSYTHFVFSWHVLSLLFSPSLSLASPLVLLMYAQAPIRAPFFPLVEIAAC